MPKSLTSHDKPKRFAPAVLQSKPMSPALPHMEHSEEGGYVRFEDYQKLLEAYKGAVAQLQRAGQMVADLKRSNEAGREALLAQVRERMASKLSAATGESLELCKAALTACNGDHDDAKEWMKNADRFCMCLDCGTWKKMQKGNHHPWCGCGSDRFDWGNEKHYDPEAPRVPSTPAEAA